MEDFIEIYGLEHRRKELEEMQTTSSAMSRELRRIIRKNIQEARRNIVKDAQSELTDDPRQAYRAVRYAVYKRIFGGQVNILNPSRRGVGTKYQRPRKLDDTPHQRGGNRRQRNADTIRIDSYQGADRAFILRMQNSGTGKRSTRYGNRGAIRGTHWFPRSSASQIYAASTQIAEDIEKMLSSEFQLQ